MIPKLIIDQVEDATACPDVREHFPRDGSDELRRLAIGAILAGRLKVPAPEGRWGAPAPLQDVVHLLGAHAFHSRNRPHAQQLIEPFRP